MAFGDPVFLVAQPRISPMAVTSLVFGCLFFLLPAAVVAVVLGHISRGEIARSAGRVKGAGIALGGLILGYTGLALLPLFIVLFAAALIPNLLHAQVAANEASAVGSLRTIMLAVQAYSSHYKVGYPQTLSALGPAVAGTSSVNEAGLIDSGLASGIKNGYVFSYGLTRNCCGARGQHFNLSADPVNEGITGQRHFFVDDTGIIHVSIKGPASTASPLLE